MNEAEGRRKNREPASCYSQIRFFRRFLSRASTQALRVGFVSVLLGLFFSLLGFGFGVGTGSQLLGDLAYTHRASASGLRFESVEPAENVQILGDMSSGDTLAEIFETVTCRGRIFAGERFSFASEGSVVGEDIIRRAGPKSS